MPGALLSALAHAAMIGAAAYGLPWMERHEGAGGIVAATLVSEAELATASAQGELHAAPPTEPAVSSSVAPARPPAESAPPPPPENKSPPPHPAAEPNVLAAPDPALSPEAAAPEASRVAVSERRPLPRPKRPPEPRMAEPSTPPSPGDVGRGEVARPRAERGGGPGSDALMNAMSAAVRAELVRARGLVERARERAHGVTGDPLLEMTISRAGRLESARVLRSSGSALVDAAALRAARAARRYPAAPEELPGPRFVFQIWLRFEER